MCQISYPPANGAHLGSNFRFNDLCYGWEGETSPSAPNVGLLRKVLDKDLINTFVELFVDVLLVRFQ